MNKQKNFVNAYDPVAKFSKDFEKRYHVKQVTQIKTVLKTTTFEKLKQSEIDHGFSESVTSRKDKDKKIPFFNLGPKNNWREIISDELKIKLENIFEKDLKELSY